jgi:hypothetical protein
MIMLLERQGVDGQLSAESRTSISVSGQKQKLFKQIVSV